MSRKLKYAILGADLIWIAGTLAFVRLLQGGPKVGVAGLSALVHVPTILAALSIWVALYFSKKLEGFCRGWHLPSVFAQMTVGVLYLIGSLLVVALCAKHYYSWLELLYFGCLLPLGFIGIRCFAWRLVTWRSRARSRRRVVILGVGRMTREVAHKITLHPEMGMEVAGVLFPSDAEPARQASSLMPSPISLRGLNILNLLQENNVQDLIIVEPVPPGPEAEKLISSCRKAEIRIHLVPQHYELYLSKAKLKEIDDVPLLSLEEPKLPVLGLYVKRGIDFVGALLLLVFSAPLLALSSAGLCWNKQRAFRKELRCGKNGIPFWMYRLNIDRDAEYLEGHTRLLVQFSLTELPQLWNVLKGEMSLVGPRPESPDRVRHYSVWQHRRLSVYPGLTGLAQVHGLREQHSSEEKARFDLQYISQWSLFLDLSLLLQTAWALFFRLIKDDRAMVAPVQQSKRIYGFTARGVMNVDRSQSGAD